MAIFNDFGKEAFENMVGKEENAGNQHFLRFPQYFFFTFPERNIYVSVNFILSSANTFNLDESKNVSYGKDLNRIFSFPYDVFQRIY